MLTTTVQPGSNEIHLSYSTSEEVGFTSTMVRTLDTDTSDTDINKRTCCETRDSWERLIWLPVPKFISPFTSRPLSSIVIYNVTVHYRRDGNPATHSYLTIGFQNQAMSRLCGNLLPLNRSMLHRQLSIRCCRLHPCRRHLNASPSIMIRTIMIRTQYHTVSHLLYHIMHSLTQPWDVARNFEFSHKLCH